MDLTSPLKRTQVEVPDGSKYVQAENEGTRGASCVQNYIVWKHQKTHESRHERTKVWRTHESLDIENFRLGRSGDRYFPSGTVWTYLLPSGISAWVELHCLPRQSFEILFWFLRTKVCEAIAVNFWHSACYLWFFYHLISLKK